MLKRLLTILICLLFLSSIANAWLAGYGFRKKITIQGANLDANVTHFPLLIYIVDADIDDECDDDGDRSFDIRFTQSDDSVLDVNWEDYSEAGGNATITAWVSDAGWTIQSDGTTYIYLYYGNAAAGDPGTDLGVWDANYVTVYHCDDLTTSTIEDTTSTGNDATKLAANEPIEATGKVYKAQDFDGSDDSIKDTSPTALASSTGQVSFWVRFDGGVWDTNDLICIEETAYQDYLYIARNGSKDLTLNIEDGNVVQTAYVTSSDPIGDNDWHYITVEQDGVSANIYIDGAEPAAGGTNSNYWTNHLSGYELHLGLAVWSFEHEGCLEEMRFSSTDRGLDWHKFEYYNMNEADNELTWAGEEEAPANGEDNVFFGMNFLALCLCLNLFRRRK